MITSLKMISKEENINKKIYIKPEVTKVAVDTSLVLMQPSLPAHHHAHHHGHTSGAKGDDGVETPFTSPFKDSPFE